APGCCGRSRRLKRSPSAAARASFRARDDKWYLGAGDGLIWAPPFPQWVDAPGFWDEAHLFQYVIRPLFTLTFLTDGRAAPVRCVRRRWTPALLTLEHALGSWRARETRSAPGGVMYLGLQRRLRLPPRGTVRFSASVALELEVARPSAPSDQPSDRPARRRTPDRPGLEAERRWHEFLGSVPTFRCSDPYLDGHWRHR